MVAVACVFASMVVLNFHSETKARAINTADYALKIETGKTYSQDGKTRWVIPAILFNNTDDTLRYLSMSCSSYEFYAINNDKLMLDYWDCDKNIEKIINIPPHHSRTDYLDISSKQSLISAVRFKIGFNLLNTKSLIRNHNIEDYWAGIDRLRNTKNMIWSNEISIP